MELNWNLQGEEVNTKRTSVGGVWIFSETLTNTLIIKFS